jgi:hypothetical protein
MRTQKRRRETYVREGNAEVPRRFRGSTQAAEERNADRFAANAAKLVHILDLAARMAFQGLDTNEIGYVRGNLTSKANSARRNLLG